MTDTMPSDCTPKTPVWQDVKQDFVITRTGQGQSSAVDDKLLCDLGLPRDEPPTPFWVSGFV